MKMRKKQLLIALIALIFILSAQAYSQDWPHNESNGVGCDSCHFIYGTEPALLPPWTAHEPQDIDDTQFNTLCWSCHNDIDAPYVNTHSSLQIDNSYGDWSIECRVCHNQHGHEQIRTYGSASYVYEGTSTDVTPTTITQTGAGWTADQWKGLLVFPNVLELGNNYKTLSNTSDTLTVQGPINTGAVSAGNTFVIVYSKLIPASVATPNSGDKIVRFFDYAGPNSFADGDTIYDGICEVCHTMTTHHRNDGTGPEQSHNDGMDCIGCHAHMDGFAPSGGVPAAPHNTPEFIANCDYCHVTATDFSSPIPDSKCEQCHTETGALKASFPSAPDVLTHQGTNCVGCHEPMFGTVNQKLVRSNLTAVGGGANAVFPPYITGSPGYNGVCETCHTMTNHHRNDGSGPFQDHNNDSTCTVCHPHANAFLPDVVPPPTPHDVFDCEVCHVTPDTYVPNAAIPTSACLGCHDGSQATQVASHFDGQTCVECHNPMSVQTNFRGNTNRAFIRSMVRGTNIAFEAKTGPYSFANDANIPTDMNTENYICNTCHTATNHHQADGEAPGGQSHFDGQDCTACHTHPGAFRDQFNIPVPPPHDGFDCTVCHVSDDTYVPNAAIPNSACLRCHDGSQAIPVVSHFDLMLCVECHNPMSVQTNFRGNTNRAFIRSMVRGTNIAFEAQTGPYSFADDSGMPADMDTENYICNTCHTSTNHHQADGNAPGGQSHFDGQDCTACHPHGDAFMPTGGDCLACHNQTQPSGGDYRRQVAGSGGDFERFSHHVSDGSANEIITAEDCEVCHDQANHMNNQDPQVFLKDFDGGSSTAYNGTGASVEGFCLSCHDADSDQPFSDGMTAPDIETAWTNSSHGNAGVSELSDDKCLACHGGTDSTQSETVTSRNAHGSHTDSLLSLRVAGKNVANAEEELCFACHDGSVASTDIAATFAGTERAVSRSDALLNTHHDVTDSDQSYSGAKIECTDCHDPHAASHSAQVTSDPDPGDGRSPSAGNTWSGSTFISEFCLDCHDNSFPDSVTPPTNTLTNIYTAWDPANGSAADQHGSRDASNNVSLREGSGYRQGDVLQCTDCHNQGHGDEVNGTVYNNLFNLKAIIYSKDGRTPLIPDWSIPGENSHLVRVLDIDRRNADALSNGRAFCSTCHPDPMGGNKESGCMAGNCHGHGSSSF